jgi:hypothetical protein
MLFVDGRRARQISTRSDPCRRATAEMFTPGTSASEMIRAFASGDQRRRDVSGLASRTDTSELIS